MRALFRSLLLIALIASTACGGSAVPAESVEPGSVEPGSVETGATDPGTLPPSAPPARAGTVQRRKLDAVLDQGLGSFLSRIETEPHLEHGRFVGFRLTGLHHASFQDVDLQLGDTLVSINGMPIERPEQALRVWNGLRVASELTVEYLRAGDLRQLRFAIE